MTLSRPKNNETPVSNAEWLRWAVLASVWFAYTAFGLVVASLAPLVPIIEHDLNISHAAIGSILGAWQLVYIGSAIPCGMMLDRLGPRRALLIGICLIGTSALARSVSESYTALLLAVMLFGLGGPVISAGAPKVIAHWFEGSQRGLAMGIYLTGPALGGVISFMLTHSVLLPLFDGDWRLVMRLWAAIAFLAALCWWLVANLPAVRKREADLTPSVGQSQWHTIKRLLCDPPVRLLMIMSIGVFSFNHGLNNWLPEMLRHGGMTAVHAGYWASLPTIVGVIGSLIIPKLATPERRFHVLFALCGAAALACVLLQLTLLPALAIGLLMQGIARSALLAVMILTLVELPSIGKRHTGTATGMFFAAAEVGGVLGPLSLGIIYDTTGGFSVGLTGLTAICIAMLIAAVYLRRLVNHRGNSDNGQRTSAR